MTGQSRTCLPGRSSGSSILQRGCISVLEGKRRPVDYRLYSLLFRRPDWPPLRACSSRSSYWLKSDPRVATAVPILRPISVLENGSHGRVLQRFRSRPGLPGPTQGSQQVAQCAGIPDSAPCNLNHVNEFPVPRLGRAVRRFGHLRCVFRGIPAGYSDGKRPRFRAKPAIVPTGKWPLLSLSSERWPEWLGKLRCEAG